jgi:formylglycine-generating enzyme required for sulfatase activity
LLVGGTETLTATVANTDNKTVTWSSSNTAVVTVNSSGLVTSLKSGKAMITVTTADGGFTAQCSVFVYIKSTQGIDMMWINAGTFTMGSPATEPDRSIYETQHQVTLTKGFYMGKYQVTQEQYQAVMGSNPSNFTTTVDGESETPDKLPVEMVSWYDAIEFCNTLSAQEGLSPYYVINKSQSDPNNTSEYDSIKWTITINSTANGYRLPTEAEWEYACRAGTTTAYNTGNTISDNTGWYKDNSEDKTHKVGLKPANAWGLYDMSGNVWEWCWDWYKVDITTDTTDPTGAVGSDNRLVRGGGWNDDGHFLRSARRCNSISSYGYHDSGFRLVRN